MDFLATFFDNYGMLLAQGTWDTLLMTIVSTFFAYVIGIPLGVLCVLTSPKGLMPHRIFNMVLGWIINIGRSIPFIILLVALIPFTRFIVGTSLGVPGAIVPLVISAAPFIARMVEQSIEEVDGGWWKRRRVSARTPGRSFTRYSCVRRCLRSFAVSRSYSSPSWVTLRWQVASVPAVWVISRSATAISATRTMS